MITMVMMNDDDDDDHDDDCDEVKGDDENVCEIFMIWVC